MAEVEDPDVAEGQKLADKKVSELVCRGFYYEFDDRYIPRCTTHVVLTSFLIPLIDSV